MGHEEEDLVILCARLCAPIPGFPKGLPTYRFTKLESLSCALPVCAQEPQRARLIHQGKGRLSRQSATRLAFPLGGHSHAEFSLQGVFQPWHLLCNKSVLSPQMNGPQQEYIREKAARVLASLTLLCDLKLLSAPVWDSVTCVEW